MSQLPKLPKMLQALVGIPSVSSTLPDLDQSNRQVVEQLADWCRRLGMQVELQQVDQARDKWNLIARIGPGEGGLVLAGHTDTVPYDQDAWQTDPFKVTEEQGRWYGLGICDMKAFFPLALMALEEAIPHLKKPVILVATSDEESDMAGARELTKLSRPLGDYVLIGEPTGMRPIFQHKGIMMEEIRIEGQSGHSSNPALGRSALEAMTDAILALRQLRESWQTQYRTPGFEVAIPTLNLGCIHGGDNPNRICRSCRLQLDVRLMPGMEIDKVRESITECLKPVAEQHRTDIQLTPLFAGVGSFRESVEAPLIRLCEQYSGQAAGSVAFATEAPFFKALGAQTVVLGPGDIDQAHQPDEYLAMDRIDPMLILLRELIRRLCVDTLGS